MQGSGGWDERLRNAMSDQYDKDDTKQNIFESYYALGTPRRIRVIYGVRRLHPSNISKKPLKQLFVETAQLPGSIF